MDIGAFNDTGFIIDLDGTRCIYMDVLVVLEFRV